MTDDTVRVQNAAPMPDTSTARGRLWWAIWEGFTDEAKDRLIADYREELAIQLAEQIIADAEGVHGGAADGRYAAAELIDPRHRDSVAHLWPSEGPVPPEIETP